MKIPSLLAISLASLSLASAADPDTMIAAKGELLLSEDFAAPVEPAKVEKGKPWTSGWRLKPGKWEVADRGLNGSEVPADKHGAVARYPLAFQDVVIQYDVRLDGTRQTTLSINDQKEHVCRVLINPAGFSAQKDDHDHDGPDQAKPFGKVALPISAGEWKTVVLEIVGEEIVAHIDGKSVSGTDPLIGTAKANFGFTVAGESSGIRNLRVWKATAK